MGRILFGGLSRPRLQGVFPTAGRAPVFSALARFSVRFRWLVIAAWIIAVPVALKTLPSLASVSQSSNSQFLPADSPSMEAAKLAAPFQGKQTTTTATIVMERSSGPLTAADQQAAARLEQAVAKIPGVSTVRDQGLSSDGQAGEIMVGVSSGSGSGGGAKTVVSDIRAAFGQAGAPPGLTFHLTGRLAQSVDADASGQHSRSAAQNYSIILIIVLLLFVYGSLLAPLVTLLPAGVSLTLAGPLIAESTKLGLQASEITQILLIVLILGAGTDYGLFLVFRMREELRRGLAPRDAVIKAMSRVGESITFSAFTVMAALLSLLLATFGIYKGIGPGLTIGLAVMLLAALTFLPALLAVFGRAVFWPSNLRKEQKNGLWGRLARRIVKRPLTTLLIGVVLFGALAAGVTGYQTVGFSDNSSSSSGSDSAQGTAVITKHFPAANNNPELLLLKFDQPVWNNLAAVAATEKELSASPLYSTVGGPFADGRASFSPAQLARLQSLLGPAASLPPAPPAGLQALAGLKPAGGLKLPPGLTPARVYQLYRSTAQFISPGGRTVQFYAQLSAGASGSNEAMHAVPAVRGELARVAGTAGASKSGVAGLDSAAYDVSSAATSDLWRIVPIVLVIIAALLAVMLRSLIAPWYLIATVGLSYLSSLGFAMIVFVHWGGQDGLNFILPFLMFVFSMALGEDYNILVMSRIREEAHGHASLREAVARAVGVTGGTVTSAGLILAGTFAVLGVSGGNAQIEQIGFSIAFGIMLDTFFVRTLLVPSVAVLLDRWNWWPSRLFRSRTLTLVPGGLDQEADRSSARPEMEN